MWLPLLRKRTSNPETIVPTERPKSKHQNLLANEGGEVFILMSGSNLWVGSNNPLNAFFRLSETCFISIKKSIYPAADAQSFVCSIFTPLCNSVVMWTSSPHDSCQVHLYPFALISCHWCPWRLSPSTTPPGNHSQWTLHVSIVACALENSKTYLYYVPEPGRVLVT